MICQENGRLIWRFDGETVWVEPWGENSLRVRAAKTRAIDARQDWALLPKKTHPAGKAPEIGTGDGTCATIRNGGISAALEANGRLTYRNAAGKVILQEFLRSRTAAGANFSAMSILPREYPPIAGGGHGLKVRFESDPGEKIYGMGQYQQEIFNLKGSVLELAQRNSQVSVPFYLSDLGYGFLWNNPCVGKVTFGTNVTEWEAKSTPQMDYWITVGETPAEIAGQYASATGLPPMMPDFATGFWQCKLRYQTQEEVLSVAREYKRRGLPISVIIVDFFHWPNQGVWDFDPEYWPDPAGMVRELEQMGIRLMVSVWPTVDPKSPNYPVMLENGYLAHTDHGARTMLECNGNEAFFDATHPGAREFVWERIKKNYYERGVRHYWLDAAEPETLPYDFENIRYHAGTSLEVGNIYPYDYGKTVYDGLVKAGETEIINLERCAWAGSQRIGTLVWSGDIVSDFTSMRRQVVAGLQMAVAGIPWWTMDIGGFAGGKPEDPDFRELLIRWFEYGAFCPVFRLHGERLPLSPPLSAKLGGGFAPSGAGNEVWSFGEEAYRILKKYMLLREHLRPYIREQMKKAHESGVPPMRPLFYDFYRDPKAWDVGDSFLFGPDLLVSPVTEGGMRRREVYLPAGAQWTQAGSGRNYEGGVSVLCDAPLDTIPVFVRKGGAASQLF